MITKVSYNPYTAGVSNGQNQTQNVNFGGSKKEAVDAGRHFVANLIPSLKSSDDVPTLIMLLRQLENEAGGVTVQELLDGIRETKFLPGL